MLPRCAKPASMPRSFFPLIQTPLPRPRVYPKSCTLIGLTGDDAKLLRGRMPDTGVPVLLLRCDALYARTGLYQCTRPRLSRDNAMRFATLSAAAVRIAQGVRGLKKPDIVHAHDWHTGLTPLLLKDAGVQAKSVFTIHNLAFQDTTRCRWACRTSGSCMRSRVRRASSSTTR